MQFVDVKNDIAFRKIFGNDKKSSPLISFLNDWSKDDLIAYDNASIAEQDERGKITAAEKKGEKKLAVQIAKEMKKEGEPIDKIIRYTGLTEDEINEI